MKICLTALSILLLTTAVTSAQEKPATPLPPATIVDPLTPAEQEFVKLLTEATLVGKFSMDLQPDAVPRSERYSIDTVRKVKDDQWIIQSRMKVGQAELPIPVPVHVLWAGDTPMIQLTDLTIPLVGDGFTARVMFYGNRYAGTWQHGNIGGHMWGIIEKPVAGTPEDAKPAPAVPVEKDDTIQ
ncbi:hypothetical protein SH661x_000712 [Planctomicrobium sp. SH661]|uniref:hypothetical protein n=1 Tax=Planctomicrobium sp. SH661 TaxID=3448124 RepID=UPI003F5CAF18